MEKSTPHCKLSVIRKFVEAGQIRTTQSALFGARSLGLVSLDDMVAIVLALAAKDFYKSMTAQENHRVWQDVYRPMTVVGQLYIKLTVIDDVLIVSFKEL